jgi:hypothetical protein
VSTGMLTRIAGEFLLRLLEQPDALIVQQRVEDLGHDCLRDLTECGALISAGASRSIVVECDGEPRSVDLVWIEQRTAYGYFDAADGYVFPPVASFSLLRIDVTWWLRWLTDHLALVNAAKPVVLVENRAWDLGELWVTVRDQRLWHRIDGVI